MPRTKRKNLNKDEIRAQMAQKAKIAHITEVVRGVFPLLDVDSVYDAQTVVNALAGLIAVDIEKKVQEIKLSEVNIDLSSEKDGKIKTAILAIIDKCQEESAQELSETLERLGSTLQAYGTDLFLRGPMSAVKVTDIVSE